MLLLHRLESTTAVWWAARALLILWLPSMGQQHHGCVVQVKYPPWSVTTIFYSLLIEQTFIPHRSLLSLVKC